MVIAYRMQIVILAIAWWDGWEQIVTLKVINTLMIMMMKDGQMNTSWIYDVILHVVLESMSIMGTNYILHWLRMYTSLKLTTSTDTKLKHNITSTNFIIFTCSHGGTLCLPSNILLMFQDCFTYSCLTTCNTFYLYFHLQYNTAASTVSAFHDCSSVVISLSIYKIGVQTPYFCTPFFSQSY